MLWLGCTVELAGCMSVIELLPEGIIAGELMLLLEDVIEGPKQNRAGERGK